MIHPSQHCPLLESFLIRHAQRKGKFLAADLSLEEQVPLRCHLLLLIAAILHLVRYAAKLVNVGKAHLLQLFDWLRL